MAQLVQAPDAVSKAARTAYIQNSACQSATTTIHAASGSPTAPPSSVAVTTQEALLAGACHSSGRALWIGITAFERNLNATLGWYASALGQMGDDGDRFLALFERFIVEYAAVVTARLRPAREPAGVARAGFDHGTLRASSLTPTVRSNTVPG